MSYEEEDTCIHLVVCRNWRLEILVEDPVFGYFWSLLACPRTFFEQAKFPIELFIPGLIGNLLIFICNLVYVTY